MRKDQPAVRSWQQGWECGSQGELTLSFVHRTHLVPVQWIAKKRTWASIPLPLWVTSNDRVPLWCLSLVDLVDGVARDPREQPVSKRLKRRSHVRHGLAMDHILNQGSRNGPILAAAEIGTRD